MFHHICLNKEALKATTCNRMANPLSQELQKGSYQREGLEFKLVQVCTGKKRKHFDLHKHMGFSEEALKKSSD